MPPEKPIFAQWQKIHLRNSPGYSLWTAIHYLDGNIWAVWSSRDPTFDTLKASEVWMSSDSGRTWSMQSRLPLYHIYDLRFANKDIGVLCGLSSGDHQNDGEIYLTTNKGTSWKKIYNNTHPIWSVSFLGSSRVIAAGSFQDGFILSTDGGDNWEKVFPDVYGQTMYIAASANSNSCYFLGKEAQLNYSSDAGKTWSFGSGYCKYDTWGIAIDSCNPNIIYAANEDVLASKNNLCELMLSTDRGNLWTTIASWPTVRGETGMLTGAIVNSTHAVFAQTITNGILRSTDKGKNWVSIGGPSNTWDTRPLAAINDNIIISADRGGEGRTSIW